MVTILRYGDLLASNFTLGPWGERTRSALGCRPLLEGNPYITDATPVYAAIQVKGETAAYVFLYPDRFCCQTASASRTINWLWMTDYRSLPAYRNSGAGVLLIQRLRQQLESEDYCLGGINMSADSQRVFDALRFPVFEKIPRYVLPLRSRPILARYRSLRPILPLVCPLGDLALRLYAKRAIRRVQTTDGRLQTADLESVDSGPSFAKATAGMQWTVDSETEPCPPHQPSTIKHQPTPEPTSLSVLESSWLTSPHFSFSAFSRSPRRMDWLLSLPPGGGRILQPYLLHPTDRSDPSDLTAPIGRLLLRSKHFASIAGGRFRDLRILSVLEADGQEPAMLVRAVLAQATREQPPIDAIEWCEDRPAIQASLQRAGFRQIGSMAFCAAQPLPEPHHITQGDGDAGL